MFKQLLYIFGWFLFLLVNLEKVSASQNSKKTQLCNEILLIVIMLSTNTPTHNHTLLYMAYKNTYICMMITALYRTKSICLIVLYKEVYNCVVELCGVYVVQHKSFVRISRIFFAFLVCVAKLTFFLHANPFTQN